MNALGVGAAFLGSLGFSMLFNVRGKRLVAAAAGGALSWTVYLLLGNFFANHPLCYGLAALTAALYAQVLARVMKSPATVFLVPSIIPLIPGGMLYNTMFSVIRGEWENGFAMGVETLGAAGAIAVGLAAASSLEAILRAIREKVRKP